MLYRTVRLKGRPCDAQVGVSHLCFHFVKSAWSLHFVPVERALSAMLVQLLRRAVYAGAAICRKAARTGTGRHRSKKEDSCGTGSRRQSR